MAAMLAKVGDAVKNQLKPASGCYSLMYGGALGVAFSGVVGLGRVGYVTLFDHDYYKNQSRLRYLEKEAIFFKEQDADNNRVPAISSRVIYSFKIFSGVGRSLLDHLENYMHF